MVSIAESFNYRIFERKRRMGEALHESSPCIPYSQCRTKNLPLVFACDLFCRLCAMFGSVREPLTLDEHNQKIRVGAFPPFERGLHCLWTKVRDDYQKPPKQRFASRFYFTRNSFTDLSAVGLPAELKHITQRRKRKQP